MTAVVEVAVVDMRDCYSRFLGRWRARMPFVGCLMVPDGRQRTGMARDAREPQRSAAKGQGQHEPQARPQ